MRLIDLTAKWGRAELTTDCVVCPPGQVSEEGSVCKPCPTLTVPNEISTACMSCDQVSGGSPDSYFNNETKKCDKCPNQQTASSTDKTRCVCKPQYYSARDVAFVCVADGQDFGSRAATFGAIAAAIDEQPCQHVQDAADTPAGKCLGAGGVLGDGSLELRVQPGFGLSQTGARALTARASLSLTTRRLSTSGKPISAAIYHCPGQKDDFQPCPNDHALNSTSGKVTCALGHTGPLWSPRMLK